MRVRVPSLLLPLLPLPDRQVLRGDLARGAAGREVADVLRGDVPTSRFTAQRRKEWSRGPMSATLVVAVGVRPGVTVDGNAPKRGA